jgi:hypothetical protein
MKTDTQIDFRIPVCVPREMAVAIKKAAEESTLSVSAYVRQAVLSKLRAQKQDAA